MPIFGIYAFLAAIVFNLKFFQGDVWNRLSNFNFFLLSCVVAGIFWGYAAWIARQYYKMKSEPRERLLLSYFGYAVMPVLLFHMGAVWCLASVTSDTVGIMKDYMTDYFPTLLFLVVGYATLLLFRPEYALGSSLLNRSATPWQVKEMPVPSVLDQYIELYSLFPYLLNSGGMGPIYKDFAIRFFDIVFIETYSKEKYVILSDGERMFGGDIFDQLKQRGLDRWMLKISKNFYINTMLIFYPVELRFRKLKLQPEVYENMLTKLSQDKIDKLREIGPGMKNTIVEDFLANKNRMVHKGWDDFIPLR